MGAVEAICTSKAKGERKRPAESAVFLAEHGIESDAHAGPWHRQVSILSSSDIDDVQRKLPDIAPGDFAENVILSGLDLSVLGLGSRIRLGGEVELSITQIGKVCHAPCRIAELTGDCIMPRLGLFARVLAGGTVAPGDVADVSKSVERSRFQAVVLTISDSRSKGEAADTAGPAVAERIAGSLNAHVYRIRIVPDDLDAIDEAIRHYCNGHSIDIVFTAGGTGFAPRDVTPEATRAVVERLTPGLDEAMRQASLTKTPHAMLSRGVSGIRGSTLVVNLPGSKRAAVENFDAIAPALAHGLEKLRGDTSPCGT